MRSTINDEMESDWKRCGGSDSERIRTGLEKKRIRVSLRLGGRGASPSGGVDEPSATRLLDEYGCLMATDSRSGGRTTSALTIEIQSTARMTGTHSGEAQ